MSLSNSLSLVEFNKVKAEKGFTSRDERLFIDGLFTKAEKLYNEGEFEQAMVLYSRCSNMRPNSDKFKLRIRKSQEAITKSLECLRCVKKCGDETSQNEVKSSTVTLTNDMAGLSLETQGNPRRSMNSNDDVILEKQTAQQDDNLNETVDDIKEFLNDRKNNWKNENPMYSKFKERVEHKRTMTEQVEQEREELKRKIMDERNGTKLELKELLEQLAMVYKENTNSVMILELGVEIIQLLNSKRNRVLPNKLQYLVLVYNMMTLTCISLGRFEMAKKYCERLLEAAMLSGQESHLCRAYETTGKLNASLGKYCTAIKCWERIIPLTTNKRQLPWLYHEIGRCYFEINKTESARVYAEWSYDAATINSDTFWELNSLLLMGQSELHLGDPGAAMEAYKKALNVAIDPEVKAYVQKCITQIQNATEEFSQPRFGFNGRRRLQLRVTGKPLAHLNWSRKKIQERSVGQLTEELVGKTANLCSTKDDEIKGKDESNLFMKTNISVKSEEEDFNSNDHNIKNNEGDTNDSENHDMKATSTIITDTTNEFDSIVSKMKSCSLNDLQVTDIPNSGQHLSSYSHSSEILNNKEVDHLNVLENVDSLSDFELSTMEGNGSRKRLKSEKTSTTGSKGNYLQNSKHKNLVRIANTHPNNAISKKDDNSRNTNSIGKERNNLRHNKTRRSHSLVNIKDKSRSATDSINKDKPWSAINGSDTKYMKTQGNKSRTHRKSGSTPDIQNRRISSIDIQMCEAPTLNFRSWESKISGEELKKRSSVLNTKKEVLGKQIGSTCFSTKCKSVDFGSGEKLPIKSSKDVFYFTNEKKHPQRNDDKIVSPYAVTTEKKSMSSIIRRKKKFKKLENPTVLRNEESIERINMENETERKESVTRNGDVTSFQRFKKNIAVLP